MCRWSLPNQIEEIKMRLTEDNILVPTVKTYEPKNHKYTKEQYNQSLENLKNTVNKQKKLGLGNPEHATMEKMFKTMAAHCDIQELLDMDNVTYIEAPDPKTFIRFRKGAGNVSVSQKPKFAVAELYEGLARISCSVSGSGNFNANIPIIPATHLEIAERVQEKVPHIQFHVAYMPQWEPAPNIDPALLASLQSTEIELVNGVPTQVPVEHWFMLGTAWGGDKELIEEHIIPKA